MHISGHSLETRSVACGTYARATRITLFSILFCLCSQVHSSDERVPPDQALQNAFETTSWKINESETKEHGTIRSLFAPSGTFWDFSTVHSFSVRASAEAQNIGTVRLRWIVHSRLGGVYQSASSVELPADGAGPVSVAVLFGEDSSLLPAGHTRPWDNLAASVATGLELRAECVFKRDAKEPFRLTLSQPIFEPRANTNQTPILLDLALYAAPPGSRATATLTFRIAPLPADPYAPDGDGDVRVTLPDGSTILAFLDQGIIALNDGSAQRYSATKSPFWHANLPAWPATGTVVISSGRTRWRVNASRIPLKTMAAACLSDDAAERWTPPLEVPSDAHVRATGGPLLAWKLASATSASGAKGSTGDWEAPQVPGMQLFHDAPIVWRPAPFWNAHWNDFGDERFPNSGLAAHMDALLARAAVSGKSQPLVILDGETFEPQGTFNWASHPLNGKLKHATDLLGTPAGLNYCRRCMRYAIARWGLSKAVSSLWLTPGMMNAGTSQAQAKLALSLRDWLGSQGSSAPIAITLHPLACTPRLVAGPDTFDKPEPNSIQCWHADTRLSPAVAERVKFAGQSGQGQDEAYCLRVTAMNPASAMIGVAGTYALGIPTNLASMDALMFDVWVPSEASQDMRVGVHLCDNESNWFETLLLGSLSPGEWTTYILDITTQNLDQLRVPSNSDKAGNIARWSDSSRQHLVEFGIHVYANKRARKEISLQACFHNIRAVRFSRNGQPVCFPLPPALTNDPRNVALLSSFEPGLKGEGRQDSFVTWKVDTDMAAAVAARCRESHTDGQYSLELKAVDPATQSIGLLGTVNSRYAFNKRVPDDFSGANALLFDIQVPKEAPGDLRIAVHLRDRDELWFQAVLPLMPVPGEWTTCALDLSERNFNNLASSGHKKAWSAYSRQRIREIGLHVYSTHPKSAKGLQARFDNVRLLEMRHNAWPEPAQLALVKAADNTVHPDLHRGDLWECHFTASNSFKNPFDARECDLSAIISTPSGKTVRVPAFFDQACERREAAPGLDEIVEPVGAEYFTVRYRIAETGSHSVTLELRENGKYVQNKDLNPEQIGFAPGPVSATLSLPAPSFVVKEGARPGAKPFHGFLRVAEDKRHFQYDDGTFYYPMGPCLRSPSDNRVAYEGWDTSKSEPMSRRGTYQYDDYFAEFEKNGMTWARVWMCPWWGALEWRRDWPGYQGMGRYNLLNAWRVDHILSEAERRGVAISLCLTNHGQYAPDVDTEWEDNPFNANLGGPLRSCAEFFTSGEARAMHQNRLRYIAARFGHSPAVLTWSLFSELEWTEGDDESKNRWHAEMATFLKNTDPNKHLVSTHFSHPNVGYSTLAVPELDVASSNAYSVFGELANGGCDASAALADYWAGNGQLEGFHVFNKPALVEEQGRHFMGSNTAEQLNADLHAGLWGAMVQPLCGATGYWWWLHLHLDHHYGEYKALANFMEGEDMRPAKGETALEPFFGKVESEDDKLQGRELKSDRRAYLWIYHRETPLGGGAESVSGASLGIKHMQPGIYQVEFWDTYAGKLTGSQESRVKDGDSINLKLPVVKRDIAVKVKRKAE